LAIYENDKRWYRAKFEAVNKEDYVKISNVDYGNGCAVKTFNLRG
jgi:hypothetical protein